MRPNLSQSPLLGIGKKGLDVSKLFKPVLWTGNSADRSITGVGFQPDLLWVTHRDGSNWVPWICDSVQGANKYTSNNANPQNNRIPNGDDGIKSFNADGFSMGSWYPVNNSGTSYVGWSFKRAKRFFDIVTWTGNGSSLERNINHDLGLQPALIIAKRLTGGDGEWAVTYAGNQPTSYPTAAFSALSVSRWQKPVSGYNYANVGYHTESKIRVDSAQYLSNVNQEAQNISGSDYIAYLFADDASPDGVIRVGVFETNGTSTINVTTGWQPQYVMIKAIDIENGYTGWAVFDTARGIINGGVDRILRLDQTSSEYNTDESSNAVDYIDLNSSGFTVKTGRSVTGVGSAGYRYLYLAIRAPGA